MKTSTIILISVLVVVVIALPLLITACSSKFTIKKYTAARDNFAYTIIDNLHLSTMNEELLANEDRGFRGEVYYTLGAEKVFFGESENYKDCVNQQLELYGEDKINILQCYIYLTEYREKDLDDNAIRLLKEYFEFLKSKNVRVLLRFAYEYTADSNNDAKDKQILRHLDSIQTFIQNNEKLFNDVVYAMQFGLLGLWGEGHGYHYKHNTRKLLTKLAEIIPENIYIMVRTPEILSQVPEKYEHRFSVHDDFLIGFDHKWGMMSWDDPYYKDLLNKNQYAISDGEMPWGRDTTVPVIDPIALIKQCVDYGLTSLSVTHNYKEDLAKDNVTYHLEKWKDVYLTKAELDEAKIPYLESMLVDSKISAYKYLQYHLGYNLGVSNLLKYDNKTSFMINNFGMAAPFEYEMEIIADGEIVNVKQSLLTKFGQQVITIDKKVNQIKIRFKHRRTGSTIRLANAGSMIYDNDGYNIFNI